MAVDETPPPKEEVSGGKEKSKKNMILFAGIFILLFILASAANFVHLKMTYVPPEPIGEEYVEEPVVHEEEGPVLTIDLGEEEAEHIPEEVIAEAVEDTLEKVRQDSIAREDSIRAVIESLEARIREGDALLAEAVRELNRTKHQLKAQIAEEDSLTIHTGNRSRLARDRFGRSEPGPRGPSSSPADGSRSGPVSRTLSHTSRRIWKAPGRRRCRATGRSASTRRSPTDCSR